MSSGQTFTSSSAFQPTPKAAVKSNEVGQWHQAGDLASGILGRIQRERLRQAALVASTANDPGDARISASPDRLAS
jgi:hypothetical protein